MKQLRTSAVPENKSGTIASNKDTRTAMKLLVFIHEYPPDCGGGGIHAYGMVKEICRNHSVTLILPHRKKQPHRECSGNCTIIRVPTFGKVNAETQSRINAYAAFTTFIITGTIVGLVESFRTRFDCIHSYFAIPAGLIGMITGRLRNIRHMVTLIEADVLDPGSECTRPYGGLLRILLQKVLRTATARTAISRDIADAAQTYYGPTGYISVVHPGIAATSPLRINTSVNQSADSVTILSTGRLVERKDFPTLLQAFSQMKNREVRLVIIGDGPLRNSLIALARKTDATNRITFTGHVSEEEKYRQLLSADIFALTSRHEGFGIVIAEAMNCALPIVATDSGGQRDLVEHGKNGFLAPAGDTAAISEYLDILTSDPALRRSFGNESTRRVPAFYDSVVAASYLRLIEASLQ